MIAFTYKKTINQYIDKGSSKNSQFVTELIRRSDFEGAAQGENNKSI